MGGDLTSDSGDSIGFGYGGWAFVLEIPKKDGWQPQGTEPPADLDPSQPWEEDYGTSDGRRVSAADARALADALDAVVADPKFHVTVIGRDANERLRIGKEMGPELAAAYVGVTELRGVPALPARLCRLLPQRFVRHRVTWRRRTGCGR